MVATIVILGIVLSVCVFIIYNLFKKLEKLEDENETNYGFFIASFNSMKSAYMKMKDIDTLGSFESDDESGSIFAEIKSAMNSLNDEFNLDNNVEETEGRN